MNSKRVLMKRVTGINGKPVSINGFQDREQGNSTISMTMTSGKTMKKTVYESRLHFGQRSTAIARRKEPKLSRKQWI